MEVVEDDSGQTAPQETAKRWRRGFYQGEKSWEKEGPKPGDVNEVVRRYASQKSAWPAPARLPQSELERALSSAALRLEKAAAKKRRQTEALRVVESSSSSSFKSSSDSDESASE
jgi:predicted acyl esterase